VLSKSDLSIVQWLCEQVSPKQLFNTDVQNPLLSQPVILSLVHQLSLELDSHTELKLNWIQEALMMLNPNVRRNLLVDNID
jgi:enhancer of mRNA-decapping protein 4